jgi:hypothetical protein
MRILFKLISVFFLIVPMLQCNSPDIESAWRKNEITINGNPDEWAGSIQYSNESKLGIGFINDEKNLFICMSSYDHQINRQIMDFGFTFLIKLKNGHGKIFGVRFPCGMDRPGHRPHSPREMGNNPDMMNEDFEKSLQTIQIIGPLQSDTMPMQIVQAESAGLTARIRLLPNGSLCYEVKLPLRPDSSNKLSINVGNDSILAFSCETSVPAGGLKFSGGPPSGPTGGMGGGPGGMGGGPGGGAGGGGMGGGPGGGMGGPGGGPGGGPPSGEMLQQFKAKMSIKLATKAE